MVRHSVGLSILIATALLARTQAQIPTAERLVVQADRLPDAHSGAPFAVHVINAEELRDAPQLRLDDILRTEVPGFSLFRRNSSRTANPTTQGVTLRNFGPNGAGRTLVLLDGIPLNDPFAGYVLWSQVPQASVDSILVVPGGGAGLFGNAALAGTFFLVSKPMVTNSGYAEASIANYDTYEATAGGTLVHGPVATSVFAERFATSGYPVVRTDQRGPVDNTASANSDIFDLRSQWQINRDSSLQVAARHFDDDRGNGTTLTRNNTIGTDASATVTTEFPAESAELQLSAYEQHRKFRSAFSSINETRDVETPALDQFDVPADAIGGSGVDLFGLIVLALLVNLAATLFAAGVAFRARTIQAGPAMQMPVFLILFLAPVYVPLDLLQGWIHGVASVNPITALLEAGRSLIAGEPELIVAAFAIVLGLIQAGIEPWLRPDAARKREVIASSDTLTALVQGQHSEARAQELVQRRAPIYDKSQDGHYNLISALHKSVRGSDPRAAL